MKYLCPVTASISISIERNATSSASCEKTGILDPVKTDNKNTAQNMK